MYSVHQFAACSKISVVLAILCKFSQDYLTLDLWMSAERVKLFFYCVYQKCPSFLANPGISKALISILRWKKHHTWRNLIKTMSFPHRNGPTGTLKQIDHCKTRYSIYIVKHVIPFTSNTILLWYSFQNA